MPNKEYLAIYDEQKLIADFFHNNLERFHQYDILFSCTDRETLFLQLQPSVKVLLIHALAANATMSQLIRDVFLKFPSIKILVYTTEATALEQALDGHSSRIKIVSSHLGYSVFFNALKELIPNHEKHLEGIDEKREYKLEGFERLKKNRQWIYILNCVEKGKRPKEIETAGLRYKTINTYIEEMIKETGCGNITELYAQAKKRGII